MNTPTNEQIEAALKYAEAYTHWSPHNSLQVLAAAYRVKVTQCEDLSKAGAEAVSLYHQTSIKLETAMYGPESGKKTYAKVKQQREIICTKCGLREERGEKPSADF